jgi:hypothetical protein
LLECVPCLPSTDMQPASQHDVELTLEEIYHGCSKKVTHTRKILYESGRIQEEERTLVIDAKPGLPDGTRFVFEG